MPASDRRRRGRRVALCGAVIAVVAAGAAWTWRARMAWRPPHVFVIVLDSVRADRVDLHGARASLTPFLNEFAAGSTVYERAYVPSSWTIPVVASLMTGQYPSEHRVTHFLAALDPATPTLAELLAAGGYATTGVTANAVLGGMNGFARGFERFERVAEDRSDANAAGWLAKPDGWLVIDHALRALDQVGSERPQFLYLHFMDAHMPYRFHEGLARPPGHYHRSDRVLNLELIGGKWRFSGDEVRRLEELYDGEVRYQDAMLRHLFAELAARKLLDNAVVAVLADHGEEFGDHAVFGHGASLHETAVRVPLLVRFPHQAPGRVREPVQVAGLMASILAAANVARPGSVRIEPLPRRASVAPADVFTELPESGQQAHWLHKQSVIADNAKLLVTPAGGLLVFDLGADPFERSPGLPANGTLALEIALAGHLADLQAGTALPAPVPDETTRRHLRAMGYLQD